MPLEQAQSASFEAASQQAYDALSRHRADEQGGDDDDADVLEGALTLFLAGGVEGERRRR